MREVLQVLLIGATGLAAYAVIFNWAALVVNARNQKRRGPGRVSPIFLVPQIIAFITAMFRSAAGLRFPPLGVVLTVSLIDVGLWTLLAIVVASAYRALRAER
jgi:hypothetical protein